MKLVCSGIALLLLLPLTAVARTETVECKPCGTWQMDGAASEAVAPAVDAALAKYKPPKMKRYRAIRGDIASETEAEFQASLDERPGPADRGKLREDLLRQLDTPAQFTLRLEGDEVVIEPQGGYRRRVTPGEPHARVDELGTARIVSAWRGGSLTITETYRRKTQNREVYALDPAGARLQVTRSVTRPGLPTVVVHSTYQMH